MCEEILRVILEDDGLKEIYVNTAVNDGSLELAMKMFPSILEKTFRRYTKKLWWKKKMCNCGVSWRTTRDT